MLYGHLYFQNGNSYHLCHINKNIQVTMKIRLITHRESGLRFVTNPLYNCIKCWAQAGTAFHPPFVILSRWTNNSRSRWTMRFQMDCPELSCLKQTGWICHSNWKWFILSFSTQVPWCFLPGPYPPSHCRAALPVVEQLYCGYCVKAIALSSPSLSISSIASSVKGWTYRNPI